MAPVDDPLDVEHGDDLEDVGETQEPGFGSVPGQEVDEAMHDPRGVGLARMDPRRQDHHSPVGQRDVGR